LKKLIYRIFLAANVLFALSMLISYLAVHVNPNFFALPALFGLAYPYLLLINIIFVIIWALFLKPEALISLLVIVIGLTHFSNYIKLGKPPGDKTGTFRVVSYNIRLFNYFETGPAQNSEKSIIGLLKNHQPDIICLQEVYFNTNPYKKEKELISELGGKYYAHSKYLGSSGNRYYGILTLSRFPIIDRGDLVYPASSSLSIFCDILIGKDTFRLYNNYLQSFRLRRMDRSIVREITDASGDKERLDEIKSISSSLKNGFKRRASQAQILKSQLDSSPFPVIVAGDFNDTPVSYSYRKIRKGLFDSFVTSGYGAGFTYKGKYPPNRIDYILYDNALECRELSIGKVKYSDHYPITAYFRKKN
jgi:endonuclease/exonuclease/phosphatase family metal-dependent hydrolase